MYSPKETHELKRRSREKVIAAGVFVTIIIFTAIEVHLLKLSSKLPFVNSIFFFGLMNLNILLVMVLLFLVFRNALKMILDDRRGRLGSRLKTRLVVSFLLFATIPTLFLFTTSALYIKSSFDKWFNIKVEATLQRSIEVVQNYYQTTEKNASHFARKIAGSLEGNSLGGHKFYQKLQRARNDYGLDAIEYYSSPFSGRTAAISPERTHDIPLASLETLKRVFAGSNDCKIQNVGEGELVRCGVFLGPGRGVLFVDDFIPMKLASQLADIHMTYADYKLDNPLNYPIKSTYFFILSMVTLLILFAATWTGFYVARRLTGPIEELVKGTGEVARGNLDYHINLTGGDELAKLVDSFNSMTKELRENKRDIEVTHSRLQKSNQEIEHRRKYIEVLLENVQSGVVSLDEQGRISMINPAASQLLKTSASEMIGQPYWALVPESHRDEFRDLLRGVYGTAKSLRREIRIQNAKSQWVNLIVTLSVLRDENKKQIGVVAVFDDVTEIQQMERMSAWREVAKRIAHEIKNPLTPIQLSVQRLRRRYLDKIDDDGTFGESTEIILKEVDALKTLVNEFSSFARLPEIQKRIEDLNDIVIEAVNLFKAAHESIQFDLELAPIVPKMQLDRSQLKRVLINLFDNAVAAMNHEGLIKIQTELISSGQICRLSVSDEGCGIDPSGLEQLFEPYFSTKEGGTGLGLAIVKRIVADHGGIVRAEPQELRGTRFVIEFPEEIQVKENVAIDSMKPLRETTGLESEPWC
ncbi:HAMP domain-containing protein [bacterium]|nr:HAMP domain-containing protein [bacterium]